MGVLQCSLLPLHTVRGVRCGALCQRAGWIFSAHHLHPPTPASNTCGRSLAAAGCTSLAARTMLPALTGWPTCALLFNGG